MTGVLAFSGFLSIPGDGRWRGTEAENRRIGIKPAEGLKVALRRPDSVESIAISKADTFKKKFVTVIAGGSAVGRKEEDAEINFAPRG